MTKYIDKVYLISDGGCRGNPGQGAIGFIIRDEKDRVIAKGGECIGYTTNNRAEYLRRVLLLISRTIDSGDSFFLVLMHFSLRDFIIRKPSLKKYHEWSEFS